MANSPVRETEVANNLTQRQRQDTQYTITGGNEQDGLTEQQPQSPPAQITLKKLTSNDDDSGDYNDLMRGKVETQFTVCSDNQDELKTVEN